MAASAQMFEFAAAKTIAEITVIAYPNSIGGITRLKAVGFTPSAKYHAHPMNNPKTGNLTTGITIKKQERPARTVTEMSNLVIFKPIRLFYVSIISMSFLAAAMANSLSLIWQFIS